MRTWRVRLTDLWSVSHCNRQMIRISPLVWSIGERGFIMDGLAIFVVLCCIGMVCTGINEAVEWYKRRRKRCPHGTLVKVIGGCANCEAEQRRPQERQALSAQRERASRELRGSEIRRLSEAWVSNAGAYLEMSPQQFETAIANLFPRLGYDVEQTPISCDGGKDAILRAADGKYLLECKCYGPAQSVGRRDLQILFAAMHAEQAVGGFCVTRAGLRELPRTMRRASISRSMIALDFRSS